MSLFIAGIGIGFALAIILLFVIHSYIRRGKHHSPKGDDHE